MSTSAEPGTASPTSEPPGGGMGKAFLRGSAWTVVEKWGAKAATLITFVILGRLLDPVDFGLAALALVLITIVYIFTDFGASAYVIQQRTLGERTRDTAFWATVALGGTLYTTLFASAPWLESVLTTEGLADVLRVFGVVLLISPLASVQTALLVRDLRFRSLAARTLISTAAGATVAIGLALSGFGVWALVWQQLTMNVVSVVVLWQTSAWRPKFRIDWRELRTILAYGSAISGTTLLDQVGHLSPNFLVGSLLGPRPLGFYSVGIRLPTTFLELFATVMASASRPIFVKLQTDRARLAAAFRRTVVTGSALTSLMFLMLAALAPALIPLLFGDGWEPAIVVAQIGACGAAFHAARCFDRNLRLALYGQRVDLFVSLLGCATLVALLGVTGRHGLVPLLVGNLVAQSIWWAISLTACSRLLGGGGLALALRVARNALLGGAAAAVAHVVLQAVEDPLTGVLAAGCAGVVVWLGLMALAAPDVRDELLPVVRSFLRRVRR